MRSTTAMVYSPKTNTYTKKEVEQTFSIYEDPPHTDHNWPLVLPTPPLSLNSDCFFVCDRTTNLSHRVLPFSILQSKWSIIAFLAINRTWQKVCIQSNIWILICWLMVTFMHLGPNSVSLFWSIQAHAHPALSTAYFWLGSTRHNTNRCYAIHSLNIRQPLLPYIHLLLLLWVCLCLLKIPTYFDPWVLVCMLSLPPPVNFLCTLVKLDLAADVQAPALSTVATLKMSCWDNHHRSEMLSKLKLYLCRFFIPWASWPCRVSSYYP